MVEARLLVMRLGDEQVVSHEVCKREGLALRVEAFEDELRVVYGVCLGAYQVRRRKACPNLREVEPRVLQALFEIPIHLEDLLGRIAGQGLLQRERGEGRIVGFARPQLWLRGRIRVVDLQEAGAQLLSGWQR